MTTRDNYDSALYEQVLKPQTIQASALNSGNIDNQGYESLTVAILLGDVADALPGSPAGKIELKVEHAADNGSGAPGTYADCIDSEVIGFTGLTTGIFQTIDTDTEDNRRYAIGYRGDKRFVRVTATPTNIATGGPIAMLAVKGHPHTGPVDNT